MKRKFNQAFYLIAGWMFMAMLVLYSWLIWAYVIPFIVVGIGFIGVGYAIYHCFTNCQRYETGNH